MVLKCCFVSCFFQTIIYIFHFSKFLSHLPSRTYSPPPHLFYKMFFADGSFNMYLTQALLWLFVMYYMWLKIAQSFFMTPTYSTAQFRLLWGPSPALVWLLLCFAFFLHPWNYLKTKLSWINHFLLDYILVDNVLRCSTLGYE